MLLDATDWAVAEFQGVPGLDKRLQQRLVRTAATLAERPTAASLPQRFAWAELKAAYRLIDRLSDRPDDVQAVHREHTRQRMHAADGPVLVIHDPTVLTYTAHAVANQLGPITDSDARGFIQHNTLAVDPHAHRLLGLIHQHTFCRQLHPPGETRAQRSRRTERESDTWLAAVAAVGHPPEGRCWVHVGDRAADCFGLMATVRATGGHFLIRLVQDRVAVAGESAADELGRDGYPLRLIEQARQVSAAATKEVPVGSRGGRPGRVARLSLGSVRLTVRPPRAEPPRWRHEPPLTLTVVRVWEADPPAGVEPLEWFLGTDLGDQSADALRTYCGWYEWRWATMEEYHKVQKTGLGIERVRFETKGRLRAAIALLSVVAVRVLGLRWSREGMADEPATAVASDDELRVLAAVQPTRPPASTVRQFVDAVAKLGGWLGRKCDGPPGWAAIWRGYQRLADLVLGAELADAIRPPKTSRPARCG